jgi:hypothetical protein
MKTIEELGEVIMHHTYNEGKPLKRIKKDFFNYYMLNIKQIKKDIKDYVSLKYPEILESNDYKTLESKIENRKVEIQPLVSCKGCRKTHPYILQIKGPGVQARCAYCDKHIKFIPISSLRRASDTYELIEELCEGINELYDVVNPLIEKANESETAIEADVEMNNIYTLLSLHISDSDKRILES